MAPVFRWMMLWAALFAAQGKSIAAPAPASAPSESQSFQAAHKELTDGFYKQADVDFADFVQKFPGSSLLPEAYLFQAEARLKLTNYNGALELLTSHAAQAGKRADEYTFLQAEALSQKGDSKAAAEAFGKLVQEFPGSPRRLNAAIREAEERARIQDWNRVLDLLQTTNSVFEASVQSGQTNDFIARGYLLLSDARARNHDWAGAEHSLQKLTGFRLTPAMAWRRQYLLCQVFTATRRDDLALQDSTNLMTIASGLNEPAAQAESFGMHAELLEKLQRPVEALNAYQRNLVCAFPAARQREAVLKITELGRAAGKIPQAVRALDQFITNCPAADCADVALLAVSELRLAQHLNRLENALPEEVATNGVEPTNLLELAVASLQTLTNKFPKSPYLGKAHLDLGWSYWASDRLAESQVEFERAIQELKPSPDQAVAWFKLGDTQLRRSNFLAAVNSYTNLIEKFASFPEVTNTLFEPALYQTIRAGLAAKDESAYTNALTKILSWFPNGFHTDRAVLIAGPEIGRQDPARARRLFTDIETAMPGSPLLPELQLAVARTYEEEGDWTRAISLYDQWLAHFTNHEGEVRAEYSRALACYRAGQDTNAFNYFTNFLARFPNSPWAPQAQWWVAGYYYGQGNTLSAEQNYQWIWQNTNWPVSSLTYEARMMAGRAAFARTSWNDAREYFKRLVENTNCPPELRAQAWCGLGDTLISENTSNRLENYNQAINAFEQVFLCTPSNYLAALAWGKKADCLLQCAESTQDYTSVSNAFQQVIDAPAADAKARATAIVGIGVTLEKMAQLKPLGEQRELLDLALAQYLKVFYHPEQYLRNGEKPDGFWTRKAGLSAARLAESFQHYDQALGIYLRLKNDMFPALRLENKIESLRAKLQEIGLSR